MKLLPWFFLKVMTTAEALSKLETEAVERQTCSCIIYHHIFLRFQLTSKLIAYQVSLRLCNLILRERT